MTAFPASIGAGVEAAFSAAQTWLFEHLAQPVLYALDMGRYAEDLFEGTGWFVVGLLQLAVMVGVIGPLERLRPIEPVSDRPGVRVDILYTLIHRLGLFQIIAFFVLQPVWDAAASRLRVLGVPTWQLDAWMAPWLPGLTDRAVFSLVVYLVVLDGLDYLVHRAQHRVAWWWTLHAVHHSQRQLTMWSDARNHLLDDALRATVFALAARLIGIEPGQFLLIAALRPLLEAFSHANSRADFGRVGRRLLVGPSYHRLHHAQDVSDLVIRRVPGTVPPACNFAVLFPLWDAIGGTASFDTTPRPTGIASAGSAADPSDPGRGFWQQQWRPVKHLTSNLAHRLAALAGPRETST